MESAIYHLSVKTTSRSKGQSSVSRAAYRSGTRLVDGRTGLVYDYRRKCSVEHSELIFGAGWEKVDRETLWNNAEAAETRKNSTTAREFEVALPLALSSADRVEVAREFTHWLVDRFGFAADMAIHNPTKHNRSYKADLTHDNPHMHVYCTTRDASGKKTRELDDQKSGAVLEVRQKWESICNAALEKAGCDARISAGRKPLEAYDNEITRLEGQLTAVKAEGERAINAIDAASASLALGRAGGGEFAPVREGVLGRKSARDTGVTFQTINGIFERAKGTSFTAGGGVGLSERPAGKDRPNGDGHNFHQKSFKDVAWQIINWMAINRIQKDLVATVQGVRDEQEERCGNSGGSGSKEKSA